MPDPRLLEAIDLFNTQEFFACHDVLEEIWSERLDDDRTMYQGLIHAAVALHHFSEGNFGGARKMYQSTVGYLTPFREVGSPIEIDRLLRELEFCFEELLAARAYPTNLSLPPERVPQLHLKPESDTP